MMQFQCYIFFIPKYLKADIISWMWTAQREQPEGQFWEDSAGGKMKQRRQMFMC